MKKLVLYSAIALSAAFAANAQTQRISLFEEWTGENCGPCASTNPGITTLANANFAGPMKMILLRYQVAIPSAPTNPQSLYQQNPTEGTNRQDYYYPTSSDQFAPQGRFNGRELGQGQSSQGHAGYLDQATINGDYLSNAPFALTVGYAWNATYDSITITTNITAAQAFSTANPLKLQLAIIEEEIHYATAPGSNGEKDFEFIMRKMVPNENGQTLAGTWTNGQNQVLTNKVKLPTYIWNKGEVAIVAFIQEDVPSPGPNTTRDIHQAAYGNPQPLALDAAVSAIAGVATASCNTSFTPSVTVSNLGSTTLTSATINYKIDNGTVQTQAWTGNLTNGQTDVVALPVQTTTPGAHTFYAYTTNPNGAADNNAQNDQDAIPFSVFYAPTATPVSEGFLTTSFPPTNWLRLNYDGGANTWTRVTTGNPTGSARYDFYNNAATGDIDDLVLPTMDFTLNANPVLTFDVAYNYYTDANGTLYDSLSLMASNDCGATWSQLYYKGGQNLAYTGATGSSSSYTPTSAQWRNEQVTLTGMGSQASVILKFVAHNYYGNQLYVDNVNITTVGIKNVIDETTLVNVYPNPANTNANILINTKDAGNAELLVYNCLGALVYSSKHNIVSGDNNFSISTENFTNGIYNVVINTDKGNKVIKLTVNH